MVLNKIQMVLNEGEGKETAKETTLHMYGLENKQGGSCLGKTLEIGK